MFEKKKVVPMFEKENRARFEPGLKKFSLHLKIPGKLEQPAVTEPWVVVNLNPLKKKQFVIFSFLQVHTQTCTIIAIFLTITNLYNIMFKDK